MRKTGALTALIAGSLGLVYAILTLVLGGVVGTPVPDAPEETVQWIGWGGIVVSIIVIALSTFTFKSGSRIGAVLVVLAAAIGAWLGSGPLLLFMVVAFLGGLGALFGDAQDTVPER